MFCCACETICCHTGPHTYCEKHQPTVTTVPVAGPCPTCGRCPTCGSVPQTSPYIQPTPWPNTTYTTTLTSGPYQ